MKHVVYALLSVALVEGLFLLLFVARPTPAVGESQVEILPTVTVPGATVKVPGPTSIITVKVPGPTVTVKELVPGTTVTQLVPAPGATQTIREPRATVTVTEQPFIGPAVPTSVPPLIGPVVPSETPITEQFIGGTRQDTPPSGRVVPKDPDNFLPDSTKEVIGLSIISAILVMLTTIFSVLYGYRLGRKKRAEEETIFLDNVLNDAVGTSEVLTNVAKKK